MIDTFIDNHSTYVLINGTQYQVLLDDPTDPTEMWSTILFQTGDKVLIDGGKPQLMISYRHKLSNQFEVRAYKLVPEYQP